MAKRELSKCRVWEQERRDRLKNCFTALGKLLPCYDPSGNLSKIEILQKAASLISELQTKNKDLLLGGTESSQPHREEIRKLQERIKKLLTRNEQLANLLQTAGIRVPSECGTVKSFNHNKKWSSKITPDVAENIVKRLNKNVSHTKPSSEVIQKKKQKIATVPKRKKKNVTPNENIDLNNKLGAQKRNACINKKKSSKSSPLLHNKPIFSSSLGPGTLILADGRVLPIGQPPMPRPTPTPLLTRPVLHPPVTRRSLPSSLTTPAMTRPLVTPILTTPGVTRPQITPTTVILMQRPRPVVCKPGIGAKVPIPPLKKQSASVVCDKKDVRKKEIKIKKDSKKGHNDKKLKTKIIQKGTKSFSKVSIVAQLERTVQKIDENDSPRPASEPSKKDLQETVQSIENIPVDQEISSQNIKNSVFVKSDSKNVQNMDKNLVDQSNCTLKKSSEFSSLGADLGILNKNENGDQKSTISSKNLQLSVNSSNINLILENSPQNMSTIPEGTKVSTKTIKKISDDLKNVQQDSESNKLGEEISDITLKENKTMKNSSSTSKISTNLSDDNIAPETSKVQPKGNDIGTKTNIVENISDYHCSKYNFENNLNVGVEKNSSKSNIKNSIRTENLSDISKSNFGDQSVIANCDTSELTKSVPTMELEKITTQNKEIPFTNSEISPISSYNFVQNISSDHPESNKEVSKNESNFNENISEQLNFENTAVQCINPKTNISGDHSDIAKYTAEHADITKYTFTEANISPNSKTDNEVANISEHHSELSNDIFATLSGPSNSGAHPESMSPTAAFLLAFPLVSTLTGNGTVSGAPKNGTEVTNEDNSDSRQDTPTLLQIGTIETSGNISNSLHTKANSDSTNLIALDNFSTFFGQNTVAPNPNCLEEKKKEPKTLSDNAFSGYQNKKIDSSKQNLNAYQCNTFNPFSDNPTEKYNLYSNCGYDYNFLSESSCSKNVPKSTFGYDQEKRSQQCDRQSSERNLDKRTSSRAPVNWMTTPDIRHQTGDLSSLPPFEFGAIFGNNHNWDNSYKTEEENNRWSWSPGKLLPPLIGQPDHGNLSTLPIGNTEITTLSNISENAPISKTYEGTYSSSHLEYLNVPKTMDNASKIIHLEQPTTNVSKNTTSKLDASIGHLDYPNMPKPMENNNKMFHLEQNVTKNTATKINAPTGHFAYQDVPKSIENNSKMFHLDNLNSSNALKNSTKLDTAGEHLQYPKVSKSMNDNSKMFHLDLQISSTISKTSSSKMDAASGHLEYQNVPKSMESNIKAFHMDNQSSSNISKNPTTTMDATISHLEYPNITKSMENSNKMFHLEHQPSTNIVKTAPTSKMSISVNSSHYTNPSTSMENSSKMFHLEQHNSEVSKSTKVDGKVQQNKKFQIEQQNTSNISKAPNVQTKIDNSHLKIIHSEPKTNVSEAKSLQPLAFLEHGKVSHSIGNISTSKTFMESQILSTAHVHGISSASKNSEHKHDSYPTNVHGKNRPSEIGNQMGHQNKNIPKTMQFAIRSEDITSKPSDIKYSYSNSGTTQSVSHPNNYSIGSISVSKNSSESKLYPFGNSDHINLSTVLPTEIIKNAKDPNASKHCSIGYNQVNFSVAHQIENGNVSKDSKPNNIQMPHQKLEHSEQRKAPENIQNSASGVRYPENTPKMYSNHIEYHQMKNNTIGSNFGSKGENIAPKMFSNLLDQSLDQNQSKNSNIASNFGSKADNGALKLYPNQVDQSLDIQNKNSTSSNFGTKAGNSGLTSNFGSKGDSGVPKIYPNQLEQNLEQRQSKNSSVPTNCASKLYPNKSNQSLEHHQTKNSTNTTNFRPKGQSCVQNVSVIPNFVAKCDTSVPKIYPTHNPVELGAFEHQNKNSTSNFGTKCDNRAPKLYPNQLEQNLDQHRTKNSTITSNFVGNTYPTGHQNQMEYPKRSDQPNLSKMWDNGNHSVSFPPDNNILSKNYIGYQDYTPKSSDYSGYSKHFPIITHSDMMSMTQSNVSVTYSTGLAPISTNISPFVNLETRNISTTTVSSNAPYRHGENRNVSENISIPSSIPSLGHGDHLYPIGNIPVPTTLPSIGDHGNVPVPTTLPTLVGDLALGNVAPNLEENRRNSGRENTRRKSVQNNPIGQNYDLQSTTFSVSHLVEQQKEENRNQAPKRTHTAAKTSVANRQNSHKRKTECYRQNQKWSESKRFKNTNSTNYSAEALIGDSRYQQQASHQQFTNFHPENQGLMNQQSGVYFQQQESYPAFGGYPTGFYGEDFQNSDKEQRKMAQCQPKKHTSRSKSRQHTTEIIPPYVDLSFLSMPTAISSPLLAEGAEFSAPGGGATPFPAPPSAPLYYGRHYGPNSPTTNVGGQLTSFNLSAIFPEIGGKATYSSSGKNSTQLSTSSSSYVPSSFSNA